MRNENVGARVVAALGEPGARELLGILERSDADRAALIGRLYARDDARWAGRAADRLGRTRWGRWRGCGSSTRCTGSWAEWQHNWQQPGSFWIAGHESAGRAARRGGFEPPT